ncbi:hypothetical protein [Paraburkholderia unamae]|uniref:Uncharacterized protein n=1 Tax=Paraburkholderia unamae TaxID=219649 RepID=A0ACC6RHC1_9BURK
MTLEVNLVAQAGVYDLEAKAICGNTMVTGFTSAGTTQATAAPLPLADYVVVATNAAGAGVSLPNPGAAEINILNMSANALLVYPPVGGNVNQAAVNTGFSVAAGKNAQFQSPDGTNWFATHST